MSIKQDGKAFKPGVTPTTAVKAFPRTGGGQKEGGGGQERPPSKAGTQDETKKRLANEREKLTGHFICGLQLRSGLQNVEALLLLLLYSKKGSSVRSHNDFPRCLAKENHFSL